MKNKVALEVLTGVLIILITGNCWSVRVSLSLRDDILCVSVRSTPFFYILLSGFSFCSEIFVVFFFCAKA
jgi:hypothetical protein